MEKGLCRAAVVLSGGQGKRMGGKISKQYLHLKGKPIIYYTLKAFQESAFVDEIVLVSEKGMEEFCRQEIVEKFGFDKVKAVVPGGATRCDSVYEGLKNCENADYVYIHDGVRPFVTEDILRRNLECAMKYGSAVTGMPSKDTVKIVDENNAVIDTPARNNVWNAQTPQTFRYDLIRKAHDRVRECCRGIRNDNTAYLTDDAMVLEKFGEAKVYMCEGSYDNIKITVNGDLMIAVELLDKI